MAYLFQVFESVINKKNSFLQMIKIVGNCDLKKAEEIYDKYSRSSQMQRLRISAMIRKEHHRIVYGDRPGDQFFEGINKSAPYPLYPRTGLFNRFTGEQVPFYRKDNLNNKNDDKIKTDDEFNREQELEKYEEMTEEEVLKLFEEDEFNDQSYFDKL